MMLYSEKYLKFAVDEDVRAYELLWRVEGEFFEIRKL